MFFKNLGLGSVLFVLACNNSHNFKDNDPSDIVLNFDSQCLKEIEPSFEVYKKEELSNFGIKSTATCLNKAIDYMKVRARGKTEDQFDAEELKNLLNRFLFEKNKKKIDFYKSILVLKKDIIGGSSRYVSFKELDQIKLIVEDLAVLATDLKPYAKEVLFTEKFNSLKEIEFSVNKIEFFLKKWLLKTQFGFALQPIKNLIGEKEADVWIGLINLMHGQPAKSQIVKDKKQLIDFAKLYYTKALEFNHDLKRDIETNREDFYYISKTVDSLIEIVEQSVDTNPSKKWTKEDLSYFTKALSVAEIFGQEISTKSQDDILNVYAKILSEKNNPIFSQKEINRVKLVWEKILSFLEDSKKIENKKFTEIEKQSGDTNFSYFSQEIWLSVFNKKRYYHFPDHLPYEYKISFQTLLHTSWLYEVANLVIQGYSENKNLSIEQVEEVYTDVFGLLNELDVFADDSRGSWFRVFHEGDLFVPNANGDGVLDIFEVKQYFGHTLSSYFSGDHIGFVMDEKCKTLTEKCIIEKTQKNPEQIYYSLPGFNVFVQEAEQSSFDKWYEGFEYIAKLDLNDDPLNSNNWFRGMIASQYNEIIFRKFDLDKTKTISFKEAVLAFPLFKEGLFKVAKNVIGFPLKESHLQGVFTFFIKHSRLPERSEIFKHVKICEDMNTDNEDCLFESNRAEIMKLLEFFVREGDAY